EDFDGSDAEKEGDNNVSMVPDSVTKDVNVQAEEKGNDLNVNNSLDPFELYPLLNKKKNVEEKMDKSNGTEKSAFKKNNSTISDYFVMLGESWLCSGVNLLIILVYAPQEYAENKMLWDYLVHVISKWDGEIYFASKSLRDPLRGCSFTWCHRSAKKMSKLDRFLMLKGLLGVNPNFLALTLDRYLSDHRPIMLRDSSHDYGPIPFRMYHYWFEIDGFDEMISKDQVNATDDILYKRMEIIKDIQEAEKVDNLEAAQKAKIKWTIEGDENTKFYHGILNKKHNQLGVRGVLKDGMWIDNPVVVKKEFLEHFSTR
nr:hypothetical protein [Tanacetum cinerariifolium]